MGRIQGKNLTDHHPTNSILKAARRSFTSQIISQLTSLGLWPETQIAFPSVQANLAAAQTGTATLTNTPDG